MSIRVIDDFNSITGALAWFVVTGSLVVLALVVLARTIGRDA
jgi:hypothetical protein